MVFRSLVAALAIGLCGSVIGLAQSSSSSPAPERSHAERFSTIEMRAERVETDANKRLVAKSDDADALNLRGVARLFMGRYKEAQDDLRRAVALKPDNAAYQANFGSALWKLGRAEEAIAAEYTAIKLDDKNFNAHYQLGRFLLLVGGREHLDETIQHLRRAIEIDPRQYEVRFELISAYRALSDIAHAASQLDFLWDARPSDPRVFYANALLAADRNDLNSAIKDFGEALRRDPTLFNAWQDLGVAYMKLKRWPEAVQTFAEFARRRPDSVEAAYFSALSLFNAGRIEDAERQVRRALRIDAGATEAHTLLGVILASRGNANAEANETLLQAVALNPNSFDAEFYLGRVLYAMKDYAGAVKSLRAAVSLDPRHAEARFFLGTALEAAGESGAAMTEYQELAKSDPQSAMGQLGLGALLVKQGKTQEALTALRSAVALDPKNFEGHLALGRALMLLQRFSEAVESLTNAVSLVPNRSDAHYQLGLVLRRVGRTEEANREFAIVDRLNTEFRTNQVPK